MGTPKASASVDQMSNVQSAARSGGECAVQSWLRKIDELVAVRVSAATATAEGKVAMFC